MGLVSRRSVRRATTCLCFHSSPSSSYKVEPLPSTTSHPRRSSSTTVMPSSSASRLTYNRSTYNAANWLPPPPPRSPVPCLPARCPTTYSGHNLDLDSDYDEQRPVRPWVMMNAWEENRLVPIASLLWAVDIRLLSRKLP